MKIRKLLLALSISIITINAYSQNDFRRGYIITNNFDTIYGLIEYKGDVANSNNCIFIERESNKKNQYSPKELNGYRFTEGKYYISKTIGENEEEKKVFMEYVIDGIVDIFYYKKASGGYYFIEKEGEEIQKLTNKKTINYNVNNPESITTSNRHIGILKYLLKDCPEIQKQLNNVELSHKSLINISKEYHNYMCTDGSECIQYENKAPRFKFVLNPVYEYESNELELSSEYWADFNFTNKNSYSMGVNFDFTPYSISKRIAFQLGFKYHSSAYSGKRTETSAWHTEYYSELEYTALKTSIGIKYLFSDKFFQPYIQISGIINSEISNNSYTKETSYINGQVSGINEYFDYYPLADKFWSFQGKLGCNFKISKKILINLEGHYNYSSFNIQTLASTSYDDIDVKGKITTLGGAIGIGYIF